VLVVTGKGRPDDGPRPGDRGVLRRMVPHWLALPEARHIVLGWDEAGTRQGGAGALYVRLRRPGSRA
jgi:DNA-nicking Smr family endonuclease